jgi:hypothetical protein
LTITTSLPGEVRTLVTSLPGGTLTTYLPGETIIFTESLPGATYTLTQPASTITNTEFFTSLQDGQTYYVTATTTIPAASIYHVNGGGYTSAPGQTVTVAYCPCYPGLKFAKQEDEFVYQHCDC